MIQIRVNGFILGQLWKIIHVTVIQKDKLIFEEEISVGLMLIFIALHMLVIHFCGENERDRQFFFYMIILFNWFIFEGVVFSHPPTLSSVLN